MRFLAAVQPGPPRGNFGFGRYGDVVRAGVAEDILYLNGAIGIVRVNGNENIAHFYFAGVSLRHVFRHAHSQPCAENAADYRAQGNTGKGRESRPSGGERIC